MIKSKYNFKKLLVILFSISLFLLLSHLILSFVYPESDSQSTPGLSNDEINKRFKEALYSFAIKDEWIKKVISDSPIPSYRITVPSDLPITQILVEIIRQYDGYNLEVVSEEKAIRGRTIMQILHNLDIKLKADFRYSANIERTTSKSSIFIHGRETKRTDFDSLMITANRDISALLIPSKSNAVYTKWLLENGFEYAVIINNDIGDIEFKLGENYSEKRLKLIVRNLVVAFPQSLFFAIDKSSNIYSSPKYSIFKKEFDKRRIKFFTSDSLKFINNDQPDISKKLNYIVKNIRADDKTRIAISIDAFQSLTGEFKKLIRVGYKFVKPSEL